MKPVAFLSLVTALAATQFSAQAQTTKPTDWPSYGRDPGGQRFSPLKQITPANVANLKTAWTYHMRPAQPVRDEAAAASATPEADMGRVRSRFIPSQATPIVVDGVMYLPTPYGRVVALDADTGKELWAYVMPNNDQASMRGVEYWPGTDGARPEIIFGTRSGKLIALDAATGAPVPGFGVDGIVDMKTPDVLNGFDKAMYGMSSPPLVYRNLVITGSRVQEVPTNGAAGDVRAWDARTGKLVWTFRTIPQPGEFGNDTWEGESWKNRSGVNVWTFLVADIERGIVYLPLAAPSFDRWGGDRKGMNLFSSSIVAVDAATGKYLWHFQTVHHDIWDLDLPTASLVEVKKGRRTIPAIAVMNKTAMLFLLDRVTGKPIYEVKEVPVPTETDIPDEQPWPTQPMPVTPPPLSKLSFKMSDMANLTPEMTAQCNALVKEWNIVESEMYQPLRSDSALAFFPGSLGGVDWGGAAFDPSLGYYIVNTNNLASPQQLEKQPDGSYGLKGGYRYFWDKEARLPCQKPPWGELVAVNVNNGKIAWRKTLGVTDSLPEGMRDTGRPSLGGPITTAGGLTFVGGTDDNRFRAFDSKTGKEVWTVTLPASIYGTPMTYQGKSGKQFVAAVNTGGMAGAPVSNDEVVAYSLP